MNITKSVLNPRVIRNGRQIIFFRTHFFCHSESIAIWCSPEPTWSRFLERLRTLIGNDDIFPRDGKGRSQNFESDAMKSSQPLLLVESSILLVAQVGISTRGV